MSEKISFKIGYPRSKEFLTFHLRMISVAEDAKFLQRFSDLADTDDRTVKEYEIYVDALAYWSVDMPQRQNGTGKDAPLGKGDAAAAVKEYFTERTPTKEWLADYAIRALRSQLQPDVSFL
jgi:hypothetical protein